MGEEPSTFGWLGNWGMGKAEEGGEREDEADEKRRMKRTISTND
jgi:hypothetical protein